MNRTLTRRIAYVEQYDLLAGVDIGKGQNVAVLLDRQARSVGRRQFAHERASYEQFVAWLRQGRGGLGQPRVLVGMEPTNDYWQWLAAYLEQAGIAYRLVNAFTVKKSREGSQLDYAKDDRRDALTIARLLREGQFTETQKQAGGYALLREYEQGHWRLSQALSQHKTVLRQWVERLFPEVGQVFKDLTGATATALLRGHAQPQCIARLSWLAFEQAVRADFTGQRLALDKLRQVYALAPHSIGVPDGAALQQLIGQQQATIALIEQQRAELEAALLAEFDRLPTASALLSVGMGSVTTALIAAELGDLSHFRNASQLVKLAGIQPTPNQSGNYRRHKTPMAHKGRPRLRTYLLFATFRLIQDDPAFADRYHRFLERHAPDGQRMEAIGAMMRYLLHLLWAVARDNAPYCPQLPG
jgi:transposase